MKNKWFLAFGIFVFFSVAGCASLGDWFLTDQQKQWKAEGRNIQTGLFDEYYSGKSFQEKSELEVFKETEEYNAAAANHATWKSRYDREQNRVDEENRRIQSRNQAAWADTERRAQQWVAATKREGLERRHFSGSELFEEKYEPNIPFFTQLVAIFLVDNREYARNVFTCQRESAQENQIGDYSPNVKY